MEELINSDDDDYVMRRIREDYLSDSTVTLIFIGSVCNHSVRRCRLITLYRPANIVVATGRTNCRLSPQADIHRGTPSHRTPSHRTNPTNEELETPMPTTTKNTATKNKPKSQRSNRSRKPQDGKNSRQQIEEAVADRIIELLDQGKLPPWEKDWQDSPYGFPVNTVSMKPYRGVNRWMTLLTQNIMGYTDPRWLTYRQAEALGGHVRKGEKSTTIIFWKRVPFRQREDGDEAQNQAHGNNASNGSNGSPPDESRIRTYPMLRSYRVFNLEQTQDCKVKPLPPAETTGHDPIERAEAIIAGMPSPPEMEFYENANYVPHYQPANDVIRVPRMDRYLNLEDYYNTVFHELVHATGHPKRLHRFELSANAQDLHAYGREELVAGMGSAMLSAHAGTGGAVLERDAAYIRNWRDTIQADKPMVIRAATLAQRATDLILGETPLGIHPRETRGATRRRPGATGARAPGVRRSGSPRTRHTGANTPRAGLRSIPGGNSR